MRMLLFNVNNFFHLSL